MNIEGAPPFNEATASRIIPKISQPSWAWAFLAHELLTVFAWLAPYGRPSAAVVAHTQSFHQLGHFWFQWDSLWYIAIGRYGYAHLAGRPYLSGAAFFPFLPVLIHEVGIWGAWALTQVALLTALWLAHRLFLRFSMTASQATLATFLLALNPAAVYYSTLYAEPWTLAFALASVELGHRRRWSVAAMAGLLSATTQATGVLVGLFPLVLFSGRIAAGKWREALGPMLWGVGCFLGTAGYAVYLGLAFHRPLLFASIQHSRYWNTAWTLPWNQWWQGLRFAMLSSGSAPLRIALWLAVTLLIFGGIGLWRIGRTLAYEPLAAALYGVMGLALSMAFLQRGWPLHSTVRIASVYFPLYAGFARLPRWLAVSGGIAFAVIACYGAVLFTHQWWYQ